MSKANGAFNQLQNVWKSSDISLRTKLRIFNSNVKSILLYGCETWQATKEICKRLQSFVNQCFHRIVNVRWPAITTNDELWKQRNKIKITEQITRHN
jgi:hypothetical protein